jgi:uncharacterized protein (DUF983 family)
MNIEILNFIKEHEEVNHPFFDNIRDNTKYQCCHCEKYIEGKYWNVNKHLQSKNNTLKFAIYQCDITENIKRDIGFLGNCPKCGESNYFNVK